MAPIGRRCVLIVTAAVLTVACSGSDGLDVPDAVGSPAGSPAIGRSKLTGRYVARAVESYPSDSTIFTQGFEVDGDRALLSGGGYSRSSIRLSDLPTGDVEQVAWLRPEFFGEGATIVDDRVVQLSWREHVAHVWSLDGLEPVGEFAYEGEGWGLCYDGSRLVMSDGSATLTFRDPASFEVIGSVTVSDAGGNDVDSLNELECIGTQVLANRYPTDDIVVVDGASGELEALIDASSVRPDGLPVDMQHVLNGIAFDDDVGLLLTGKFWPTIVRVKLERRA